MALLTSVLPLPPVVAETFAAAIRERGWTEGRDLVIEARASLGDPTRTVELARELVSRRPELVLALNTAHALAVMQASATVPVVAWCGYPVEAGLTKTLARPSRNVTGIASYASTEVWGKFVEILQAMRPSLREIGVLWDYVPPAFPDGPIAYGELERAGRRLGIAVNVWLVHNERDLNDALSAIDRSRTEALVVSASGGIHNHPERTTKIAELVARRRLPMITDLGGLIFNGANCALAYSPNLADVAGRLAHFVDRILRGAKPADLPFELPSRFSLLVNLKATRALGLQVPPALLARADQVIQ
jgi:putative ABC transport system substrate-binding protein